MKKLLLLLLVLFSLTSRSQTWVYHQFPDSAAVWNFDFAMSCIGSGTSFENYSITISGDTTISSQTYCKLFTPYVQSIISGTCASMGTGYRGALREDTTARRVYYMMPGSSTEELLYDFTLQVGDTVQGRLSPGTGTYDTVVYIDSILVGPNFHKRWKLNTPYNIYLIEGVGSTFGLYMQSPGYITDAADFTLDCFSQDNIKLYPDMSGSCDVISSVNSISEESETINIYPNPSNGSFIIDLNKTKNIQEICLSDMLGKKVMSRKTNNENQIAINSLSNGTYILSLISETGNIINKKLIVCP